MTPAAGGTEHKAGVSGGEPPVTSRQSVPRNRSRLWNQAGASVGEADSLQNAINAFTVSYWGCIVQGTTFSLVLADVLNHLLPRHKCQLVLEQLDELPTVGAVLMGSASCNELRCAAEWHQCM